MLVEMAVTRPAVLDRERRPLKILKSCRANRRKSQIATVVVWLDTVRVTFGFYISHFQPVSQIKITPNPPPASPSACFNHLYVENQRL